MPYANTVTFYCSAVFVMTLPAVSWLNVCSVKPWMNDLVHL